MIRDKQYLAAIRHFWSGRDRAEAEIGALRWRLLEAKKDAESARRVAEVAVSLITG